MYRVDDAGWRAINDYFGWWSGRGPALRGAGWRRIDWTEARQWIGVSDSGGGRTARRSDLRPGEVRARQIMRAVIGRHVIDVGREGSPPGSPDLSWYAKANGDRAEALRARTRRARRRRVHAASTRSWGPVRTTSWKTTSPRGASRRLTLIHPRVDHCHLLVSLLLSRDRSGVMVGGAAGATEFERSAAGIRSGDLRCAVGTVRRWGRGSTSRR
jgi:hypothetical protein